MHTPSNIRVSWGHVGTPDQWYLPGTDISDLPAPAQGESSSDAFFGTAEGTRLGWEPGVTYGGKLIIAASTVVAPGPHFEIHQEFKPVGGWNSLKNLSIRTDTDANLTVRDIVHVDIDASGWGAGAHDAGARGSVIAVHGAKRGNIQTGEDNDTVEVTPLSNSADWNNEFRIATGGGSDTIRIRTAVDGEAPDFQGKPLVTDGSLTTVLIDAGAGNDIILLSGAREIVQGGAGARDTAIYDQATEGVVAFLNDVGVVMPQVGAGGAEGDVLTGVERLKGSNFSDALHGNSDDNDLIGGFGDDQLTGGGGHDHFVFGRSAGFDTVMDFTVGEDTVEIRGQDAGAIHQRVTTIAGDQGLLVWLTQENGYDVASMFLRGVTSELTVDAHAGDEANWHDAVLLS